MTTTPTDICRRLGRVVLICILVSSVACGKAFESEKQELEDGKSLWAASGTASYQMEFTMRCNCEYDGLRQEALVCDGELRSGAFSVTSIFDLADMAIADGDKSLRVSPHAGLGYPKTIRFGSDLGFDSEVQFKIDEVRPIDDVSAASCNENR